ncbi:uncharacterized protein LOC143191761 isoform X1 [Rhynchophorus ferrugineus]|uniref:uncharacterized protein LOC143191761 isoform X1 n=1 Tax=Rhynchophorus ferrugineus TaxID=354439 RepID=UPI003FCD4119
MSSRVLTNEVENDEDNFECIKEEELYIKPEIEEPSLYIPETPMEENCDQDNLERLHLFTKDLHNIQQSSNTLKQLSEVRHKNDTNSGALTNEVENDGDNSDELECIKEDELHIKPEVEECTPYIAEAPIEENCDQDNLERLHLHKNVHNIQQSSITLNQLPGIRHKNDTSSRALTNEVQNDGDNFDKLYCIKQEELHIKSEIEESTPYISENPMDENSDHQEGRSIQQKMFVIYYFK